MSLPISDSSVVQRAEQYADDVVSGRQTACRKVKTACRRFLEDLENQKNADYPWIFDREKGERSGQFIERFLAPTKGNYDRMELLPWQCFCQANMYGWVDRQTGLRRYHEALIVVGSGNGKSTMVAGNATYAACKDGERGADVYLLANSKEQAGNVFNECREQIRSSKYLAPRFRPLRDGVYYDAMASSIKSRSSDSKRLDGLNPHLAIFDEIHEYRNFDLIDVIRRKKVKRLQPLIIYITTMGNVLDGPLVQLYDLFSDAMVPGKLRQDVSDRLFTYIAELDPEDDIEDSSLWVKANPSLGKLLRLDDLERDWNRCKLIPSERANFICKQLNVMVNTDDMAFVQPEVLNRNRDRIDESMLDGMTCYGGFDLSAREDFTAAALEFNLPDGRVYVKLHSWVPRRKVEMDNEKIDYVNLAIDGHLTIVDGEYIQQEDVYRWFCEQREKHRYKIACIGYDPANATRLREMLENGDRAHSGFVCEVVRQGPITLNDPMKDIKEMLLSGRVVTNDNPMWRWYTDNVRLSGEKRHTDKENWMPLKRNRYRKIDGFMAWLDAHCVNMEKNPAGYVCTVPKVRVIDTGRQASRPVSMGRETAGVARIRF